MKSGSINTIGATPLKYTNSNMTATQQSSEDIFNNQAPSSEAPENYNYTAPSLTTSHAGKPGVSKAIPSLENEPQKHLKSKSACVQ
jgi:hypothetical protein